MHIAITWDIGATGPRWTEIDERMRGALGQFSWVRPLTTFYGVRVAGNVDRRSIHANLLKVAKSVNEQVHFLISPLMASGRYDGYLAKDVWDKVNVRTD